MTPEEAETKRAITIRKRFDLTFKALFTSKHELKKQPECAIMTRELDRLRNFEFVKLTRNLHAIKEFKVSLSLLLCLMRLQPSLTLSTHNKEIDTMTEKKTTNRIQRPDSDAMETAQAERIGTDFQWHYGRVTRLGSYDVGSPTEDLRSVTVLWEEGGFSCQHGEISDEQWELLKMAFMSTGMITVLSDQAGDDWMYDLRFLEAVR